MPPVNTYLVTLANGHRTTMTGFSEAGVRQAANYRFPAEVVLDVELLDLVPA